MLLHLSSPSAVPFLDHSHVDHFLLSPFPSHSAQRIVTWITSVLFWKGWTLVPASWSGGLLTLGPVWDHICILLRQKCDRREGGRTRDLLSVSTFDLRSRAMFFACVVWHDCAERRCVRKKKMEDQHLGFLTSLFPFPFFSSSLPLPLDPFLIGLVFFSPCGKQESQAHFYSNTTANSTAALFLQHCICVLWWGFASY